MNSELHIVFVPQAKQKKTFSETFLIFFFAFLANWENRICDQLVCVKSFISDILIVREADKLCILRLLTFIS